MFSPAKITDSTGGAASSTLAAATNLDTITDSTAGTPGTTLAAIADIATSGGNTYADSAVNAKLAVLRNWGASIAAELALQKALNTVLINALASLSAKINTLIDNK